MSSEILMPAGALAGTPDVCGVIAIHVVTVTAIKAAVIKAIFIIMIPQEEYITSKNHHSKEEQNALPLRYASPASMTVISITLNEPASIYCLLEIGS